MGACLDGRLAGECARRVRPGLFSAPGGGVQSTVGLPGVIDRAHRILSLCPSHAGPEETVAHEYGRRLFLAARVEQPSGGAQHVEAVLGHVHPGQHLRRGGSSTTSIRVLSLLDSPTARPVWRDCTGIRWQSRFAQGLRLFPSGIPLPPCLDEPVEVPGEHCVRVRVGEPGPVVADETPGEEHVAPDAVAEGGFLPLSPGFLPLPVFFLLPPGCDPGGEDRRAYSRFWAWERSLWQTAVSPVGRWTARTAVDDFCMCCPPGPLERKAWMSTWRMSRPGSWARGWTGRTSTDAKDVWRLPDWSLGERWESRCTPCSGRSRA